MQMYCDFQEIDTVDLLLINNGKGLVQAWMECYHFSSYLLHILIDYFTNCEVLIRNANVLRALGNDHSKLIPHMCRGHQMNTPEAGNTNQWFLLLSISSTILTLFGN